MVQDIVLFGKNIDLGNVFNIVGQFCIVFWMIFHLKEYKEMSTLSQIPGMRIKNPKKKNFVDWGLALVEIMFIFGVIFALSTPFNNMISMAFLNDTSANYFHNIFVLPLGLIAAAIIFKLSPMRFTDYIAPAMSLALILYKIACFCDGCCYGVPTEKFGLINRWSGRKDFPIQLVEAACAIVMFIILLIVRRKKGRKPGTLYPFFMMMYCASRFVSEFWRDDYPDVLGPLKSYHFQCIIGFVEGALLMLFALKFSDKLEAYIKAKAQFAIDYFSKKPKENNDSEE